MTSLFGGAFRRTGITKYTYRVPSLLDRNSRQMASTQATATAPVDEERRKELVENIHRAKCIVNSKRKDENARLVAVSKYKPASDIKIAYESGQSHFGENYVQELTEKAQELPVDIKWHFIGRLQSNKCKVLASIPNLWAIETIDSESKARKMNSAWSTANHSRLLNVYIQVNTSGEENKGGVEPADVEKVIGVIVNDCKSLNILGLMTIGSIEGSGQIPNPDFLRLVELRDEMAGKFNRKLELSMGMSSDFEHALELGSTNVRVGSMIFGSRPPKNS